MASNYRLQLNEWLSKQTFVADQVLDVGGGDQSITKVANITANRILILDNDPATKPQFVHDLNDFRHADELFSSERNPRFDLIFCMNVFEYIWNPYVAIANLYTWLGENGTLIVNFPFLYPVHNPVGIDYLRYTHEWVNKMFHQRFKFKDVELTIMELTHGQGFMDGLIGSERMHPRKGDRTRYEMGTIVKAVK